MTHSDNSEPKPVCQTCGGNKLVLDGALTHSAGGIEYECGPIECVKDCPDCTHPAPAVDAEQALTDRHEAWKAGEAHGLATAARASEQKPVAVMYKDGTVLTEADCGVGFETCCKVETPLFTHPSPAGVVLPERMRDSCGDSDVLVDAQTEGWNACLDATIALNNPEQQP